MCHTNQDKLTESSLFDLLGCKSESREQFYYYLHQNVAQSWRGRHRVINSKSAEEVFEGREQIDECVVASGDVFDRLRDPDVTEIFIWKGEGDIPRVGWRCQRILL